MTQIPGKSRRIFRSLFILVCTVLLTSCFEVNQDVSVNRDGSGEARIEFAVEKVFAPDFIPELKRKTPAGWRIAGEQDRNGKRVLTLERKFRHLSELSDSEMRYSFSSAKSDFLHQTYSIDITMLKTSEMPFPYTLTMRVPGSIEETGGSKVSSNTVRWDMQGFRRETVLSVSSRSLDLPSPSALFGALRGFFTSLLVKEQLAFSQDSDSGSTICAMGADGGHVWRLVQQKGALYCPEWSPDGGRIVFSSLIQDSGREIRVVDANSGDTVILFSDSVDNRPDFSRNRPRWSPDGSRLVLSSNRDGDNNIYVVNADDRKATRLTPWPSEETSPVWSPDGQRIAFLSNRDGQRSVYVMDVDGTNVARLTSGPSSVPVWSPDGRKIAFLSEHDGDFDLEVVNADGGNALTLVAWPSREIAPVWSPDGRMIAFMSNRDGDFDIYVVNADGSNARKLDSAPSHEWSPKWSYDGGRMFFFSNRGGNESIYSLYLDGGPVSALPTDINMAGHGAALAVVAASRVPFLPVGWAGSIAMVASILTLLAPLAGCILLVRKFRRVRHAVVPHKVAARGGFCAHCGEKCSSDAQYCVNCGTRIS